MKLSLPFVLLAAPAAAHSGAHMHPHSVEGWVIGLALICLGTAATLAVKLRK